MDFHVCNGPEDEVKGECNHLWEKFAEGGCKDDKTYFYCRSCGLVCAVALGEGYPESCFKFRRAQLERRMKMDTEGCGECKREKRLLVNAKDFDDPRNSQCMECNT